MITIEQTASDLFDKIRNRFSNLEIGDEEGKSCSESPERARFFNFDFIVDGSDYGNITVSIADTKSVKVFYDKSIDRALGSKEKQIWFSWLRDMREFARSHFKEWDVRDIAKSGLNLNDLKFLRRDTDSVRKNEVKTTEVAESKLYGTSRSSYQKLENVRIIARHSKPIVDENIPGARSRNIESFYIENSQGERFKLPEGTTINGARAYARHVKNGGELHDEFSRHIGRMIKEMADLRMFVRNMRGRTFEDIETQQMVESAIDHYGKLHSNVHMLRSQRGYDQYKSFWQPEVLEDTDIDIAALKERFVKKIFDDRINDALPVVFREYNKRKMAVEQEFESWANTIVQEFEENPIDKQNKKQANDQHDLEEDEIGVNVKGPFANSLHSSERDSEGNMINGDNEEERLASLFNSKQFEFRFEDGVYYFESNNEIKRAKAWIAKTFPKMRFPKMGIYDYGYGVYGSTTFDRELPNGKGVMEGINEDLRKWFKEKWVRFGPDGKIRGDCARGDDSEGKPKCLPRAKAHALGKKGRKTAASRKRREDPNPERSGPAINVKTKESQQSLLEAPVQWHNTATGVKDAAQTDHTMDEALEYLKINYPIVKMYNVRRATMGLTALDQPKYVDTGNEADINKNIIRKSAAHMSGVDSAVDYLQLRKNTMMSGSQQVTLTIGYSWSVYENPNSGIAMLYYQDRGMAWDEIYLAGKTPRIQAQARQVFRDAGVLPTPMKKPKQQGVAEGLAPGQAAWKQEMIAKGAVKFQRDQHGGGAVDRIVAYNKDGKVVGAFNRKGVAEARSPEEFVRQMDAIAATPQTFEVGDWVTIDPNETSGYASSGMIGRIVELYDDEGESMAKIAVGGGSGVQTKMKTRGGVFGPPGTTIGLGKGVRSSGTHTVVPTSILQKYDPEGVAENFTDDLDNIYAMHPQPEKSEQVVFLITGMTEDEFSDRWTDLPDPYQQEFGHDLPLWDADDLSSYPNLAVKRITFDQYVQLVGNYIKSEELAGSTMSKMKQGVAEGKHSCPECGGRLVEFSQLNEKKDACYYKVKSRYKVWPSAYASGALVKCRKKGAKNWGNKSESKLTPAAKLLDSFKTDLDKF